MDKVVTASIKSPLLPSQSRLLRERGAVKQSGFDIQNQNASSAYVQSANFINAGYKRNSMQSESTFSSQKRNIRFVLENTDSSCKPCQLRYKTESCEIRDDYFDFRQNSIIADLCFSQVISESYLPNSKPIDSLCLLGVLSINSLYSSKQLQNIQIISEFQRSYNREQSNLRTGASSDHAAASNRPDNVRTRLLTR